MSRSAAAYQKFTEDEIRKANSVDTSSPKTIAFSNGRVLMMESKAAPLILSCGKKTCPSPKRWAS